MNLRNKWLVGTIRVLLGLFFIFSGIGGFMAASNNWQGVPPETLANTQMLWDTGIFHIIKVTEIIAGLMLVVGFLPWLGAIFLAPVGVGAVIVNARTTPQYIWVALICSVLLVYLGYAYWDKYKQLFTR